MYSGCLLLTAHLLVIPLCIKLILWRLMFKLYKSLVSTSQKTRSFIRMISRLMLCGEIIWIYRKNRNISLWLISFTNFNAQFLYSLTICMLHYNPRHVSSIKMPIFRKTNYIITASDIGSVNGCTVCRMTADCSAVCRHTVQPFTESYAIRCCDNTICPPEDGHVDTRNMSRIIM